MARVAPVAKAGAPTAVAAALERAERELPLFLNQIGTLAHLPGLVGRLLDLYLAFPRESLLPRPLVELAILTVSHVNACQYCIVHHSALGASHGVALDELRALQAGDRRTAPVFDETERAVIEYAEQVTRDANGVSDELFGRLREHFTEPQIVELTLRIALCGFFNKFNQALQIDLEPEAVRAFAGLTAGASPNG